MIAAIYARKSTEQNVAEESKSTTRQVELARAYAAAQGWTVDDRFIFIDDGISGAEFEKRPALSKMREMLRGRAPFGVLIVRDRSRLGRESSETPYLLKQLSKARVDVRSYVDGRSLIPRNAQEKLLAMVDTWQEEGATKTASVNVTEKHRELARDGRVTGGRVYGYRNVDVFVGLDAHGRPAKSHVDREIVEEQAEVVSRIFELFSSGLGLKVIARMLRQEGYAPPKAFVAKSDKIPSPINNWAPSTIRSILRNPIYKGLLVWNKTKKRNDEFNHVDPRPRPESEWITAPVEHLRIVSNELWERCAARRKDTEGRTLRFAAGRISGRPPASDTRNLLAGLATCSVCGGGIVVETSKRKTGRKSEYVCYRRRTTDCANALRMPVDVVNEQILSAIEAHALTPEAIEQVIQLSERDDVREKQDALRKEQQKVARGIERLIAAITEGGDAASLVAKVREMEARQKAIEGELRALQPVPRLAPQVVEDRLAEWRRLLRQSVTQGRAVLQRILKGRIVFTPRKDGYDFNCETRYDKLFTGVAVKRPAFIPEGGAPALSPEDTWDSDYGGLLEAAHRKGHEAVRGRH